ncbi:MAG: hypothetical protein RLZZ440_1012, partial [Planctomycetota bacterium]
MAESDAQDLSAEPLPAGVSQRRHPPTPVPLSMDASGITSGYSNLVQVTGTAEEVILDIGLDRPAIGKNPAEA